MREREREQERERGDVVNIGLDGREFLFCTLKVGLDKISRPQKAGVPQNTN